MASQITHIVYGNKVKTMFLNNRNIDEKKYFIGNIFPDIRYLNVISRGETHPQNPVVDKLQLYKNDFDLGMYVHALIDWEREKTLTKLGVYDLLEKTPVTTTALKFLEDEITYPLYKNWNTIINYFDTILKEETNLVSKEAVIKWHNLIKLYLSRKKSVKDLIRLIGFDDKIANSVASEMNKLRKNKRVVSSIEKTFDKLLE